MSDLKDSFNTEKENILKEKDLDLNNIMGNNLKISEFEKNVLLLNTVNDKKCEELNIILEEKKVLLARCYMYTCYFFLFLICIFVYMFMYGSVRTIENTNI
jgi:hypothetical protein